MVKIENVIKITHPIINGRLFLLIILVILKLFLLELLNTSVFNFLHSLISFNLIPLRIYN